MPAMANDLVLPQSEWEPLTLNPRWKFRLSARNRLVTTILKWNGTAWAAQTGGTTNSFFGEWGATANNIWVVGSSVGILHKTQ